MTTGEDNPSNVLNFDPDAEVRSVELGEPPQPDMRYAVLTLSELRIRRFRTGEESAQAVAALTSSGITPLVFKYDPAAHVWAQIDVRIF